LGIGAGIWPFITLLVAYFLGGMVSTQVTDRPDRAGAVIHGALVWVLFMLLLLWLMASGISLGMTGLFGAVRTLTQGVAAVGMGAAGVGGDLTQRLGLDDPNQVLTKLDDPRTASTLATATGMSAEEAKAALSDLRSRVEAVRDDPARVAAEVRNFLSQYAERAKQQAMQAAAKAQKGAAIGSWITFGVMVVTLVVAIAGAMSGVPSLQRWRQAFGWLRG
jgi:cytochrome c-type biogenesis protein CcmH/NrfG